MLVILIDPIVHATLGRFPEDQHGVYPHLGLNYLASELRRSGHSVIVVDAMYSLLLRRTRTLSEGSLLDDVLGNMKPDVVGISVITPLRERALDTANLTRALCPNAHIVLGGHHITAQWKDIRESARWRGFFDALVIGEGERPFASYVNSIGRSHSREDMPSVVGSRSVAMDHPVPFVNGDLNCLPFPDYAQYAALSSRRVLRTVSTVTSRGCPHSCSFCCSHIISPKWRIRSAENVLSELHYLVRAYGCRDIRIKDESFTLPRERALAIFDGILMHGMDLELHANTRVDAVDLEVLRNYARAGGRSIYFGVESGSARIRNAACKYITEDQIIRAVAWAKECGLKVGVYLIFGLPGEEPRDVLDTRRLIEVLKPDEIFCNPCKVYPRTAIFELAKREGRIDESSWETHTDAFFFYPRGRKLSSARRNCLSFSRLGLEKIRTPYEDLIDRHGNYSQGVKGLRYEWHEDRP